MATLLWKTPCAPGFTETAERDAMVAKVAPLCAAYDAISAEIEEMRQKKLQSVVEDLKAADCAGDAA